jgi:hypothetical protein
MSSLFYITVAIFAINAQAQYGGIQIQEGLTPRFYLGSSPLPALERRQNLCAADQHSCEYTYPHPSSSSQLTTSGLDINATVCCPNTQICLTDSTLSPKCCAIGSLCGITTCDASHYICSTSSGSTACCPRSCDATSQFLCPASLGGACCSFGYSCASGGQCVSSAAPTSTSAVVGIASVAPSGCATNQIACPSTEGGGCCGVGLDCAVVDSTNYCSNALRTGDGISPSSVAAHTGTKQGLSMGVKAGIGAGVAILTFSLLGVLLWFCVVHRRRVRARSAREREVPMISQAYKTDGRPTQRRQTSDYFGPRATAGPFTESTTSLISPISPGSEGGRGVPLSPLSPGDIAAPVEIDSGIIQR